MAASGFKAAYFGYKAFQAFRLCVGDATVMVELVAELLAEGLGEAVLVATLESSAEHLVELFDTAEDLDESTRDFLSFCDKLNEELGKDNSAAAELIQGAQELFKMFTAIDTDGSGTICKQELRRFFAERNLSSLVSDEMFQDLDADNDGEITFEEFSKLLGPSNGRHEDESTLDCKGRHGLKIHMFEHTKGCDWCERLILPHTRIPVCITCEVTACHDCTAMHTPRTARRITCKPRHGLVKRRFTYVDKCSACKGHITRGATVYSCMGSCEVFVCVACELNVPEDLYSTGLRHVR